MLVWPNVVIRSSSATLSIFNAIFFFARKRLQFIFYPFIVSFRIIQLVLICKWVILLTSIRLLENQYTIIWDKIIQYSSNCETNVFGSFLSENPIIIYIRKKFNNHMFWILAVECLL